MAFDLPALKASLQNGGVGLSLPVSGRIGVAVYVAVNGAEPKLQVTRLDTQEINNRRIPVITVRNDGDAHGRLDGVLDAVGADGKALQLVPDATPILAGQTRKLMLTPKAEANTKPASPLFPLHLHGTLDWDNGSFKIDSEL